MIKRMSRKKRIILKQILYENQKCCEYCGIVFKNFSEITLDHIIPKCRNGSDDLENLTLCCSDCNGKKSHRSYKKFKKLLRKIKNEK